MVVALDLEHRGEAVADRHRAGVLARALQDARAGGGKAAQNRTRALVAAVFGPHHRADAELDQIRYAADGGAEALELLLRESVLSSLDLGDRRQDSAHDRQRDDSVDVIAVAITVPAAPRRRAPVAPRTTWRGRSGRSRRHRPGRVAPHRRARDAASGRRR